jgi:hypothetical protein
LELGIGNGGCGRRGRLQVPSQPDIRLERRTRHSTVRRLLARTLWLASVVISGDANKFEIVVKDDCLDQNTLRTRSRY